MSATDTTAVARGAYTRALNAARESGYAVGRQQLEELLGAFSSALATITVDLSEGRIDQERALELRKRTQDAFLALEEHLGDVTAGAVGKTRQQLLSIHQQVNQGLARKLAPGLEGSALFNTIPIRALQVIQARGGNAENFRSLYQYRTRAAASQVDKLLLSGTTRGVSAGQMSRDVAMLLAPPEYRSRIPSAKRLQTKLGNIDLKKYGFAEHEVADVKALLYNARRIAVTEQANAAREANMAALVASPTVKAATWQRSGRHRHVDSCDALSHVDWYDLGPGVHLVERWPHAPHPFCMCMQGGPVIFRPVEEWNQPRPDSAPSSRTLQELQRQYGDKLTERDARAALQSVRGAEPINIQVGSGPKVKAPPAPPAPTPPPAPALAAIAGPAPAPPAAPKPPRKRAPRKPKAPPEPPVKRPDQLTEAEYEAQVIRELRKWKPLPAPDVPNMAGLTPYQRFMAEAEVAGRRRDAVQALGDTIVRATGTVQGELYGTYHAGGLRKLVTFSKEADASRSYGHLDTQKMEVHLGTKRSEGLADLAQTWNGKPMDKPVPEQQAGGMETMLHEMNHTRSRHRTHPTAGQYDWDLAYTTPEGLWLEEGMVELKARRLTTQVLYGKEYAGAVRNWVPHSYPHQAGFMEWLEKESPGAVDRIWEQRSHVDRMRALGEELRPFLKKRAREISEAARNQLQWGAPGDGGFAAETRKAATKDLAEDLDAMLAAIDKADGQRIAQAFPDRWDGDRMQWDIVTPRDLADPNAAAGNVTMALQKLTGWIPTRFRK